MPIPCKTRGHGSGNSTGNVGYPKYYQSFMGDMSSSVDEWMEEAECVKHSAELFQVSNEDSPDFVELKSRDKSIVNNDLWKFNEHKIKTAREICSACPVKVSCLEAANEMDLHWTVRGGLRPTSHNRPRGRPRLEPGASGSYSGILKGESRDGKACVRGHTNRWSFHSTKNKWRCLDCEAFYVRNKKEGIKGASQKLDPKEVCPKGHSEWRIHGKARPQRRCMGCKREFDNRRAKKV